MADDKKFRPSTQRPDTPENRAYWESQEKHNKVTRENAERAISQGMRQLMVEVSRDQEAVCNHSPPETTLHVNPMAELEKVVEHVLTYVRGTSKRVDRGRDKGMGPVRRSLDEAGFDVTDALIKEAYRDPRISEYVIRKPRKIPD